MINLEAVKQLNFTPGEAAAVAMYVNTYNKNIEGLKKLFAKHEQKITGDPNIDLYQIYSMSKDKGRFFDEDLEATILEDPMFANAKLKDLIPKIKNIVNNNIKPGLGTALTVLAPVAGLAANAFAPGLGGLASGLATSLGNTLSQPKQKPGANPNELSAPVQEALQQTFLPSNTAPLDDRPEAANLLNTLLGNNKEAEASKDKILGMAKKTFYWVAGIGGLLLLAIIIILIIRYRNKKKKELAAAKKS